MLLYRITYPVIFSVVLSGAGDVFDIIFPDLYHRLHGQDVPKLFGPNFLVIVLLPLLLLLSPRVTPPKIIPLFIGCGCFSVGDECLTGL
jgi:hypothetical protein